MSNAFVRGVEPVPYRPHGLPVAAYATYAQAQRAVDRLSDEGFPVEQVAIVGTDLRMVEQVTGRLTQGRAVAAGAASGAWFGLFVGLLLALFAPQGSSWLAAIVTGVVVGVAFGATMGFVGYRATGGRRDFTSRSAIVAARYEVLVRGQRINEGRALLERLAAEPDGAPLLRDTTPAGTSQPSSVSSSAVAAAGPSASPDVPDRPA
jgi:hypothetical protein